MQLFGSSPEQKYHEFLEAFAADLDRRYPGVFQWRIGRPSPDIVEGLIVTRSDVGGYAFVVGACQWSGGIQGGVWREGARHSYSASVMKHREWEHSGMSHSAAECLESQCSEQAEDILQRLVPDWAFERPWRAPPPVDARAEKKRLEKIAAGLRSRSEIAVAVDAEADPAHQLTLESEAALTVDLRSLSRERIRDGFPPDKRGALALKTTVVLASYETKAPPARDRVLCLAAVGPQRRSDAQEIHVRLTPLILQNQDHCWAQDRWRWHVDAPDADSTLRWGAPVPAEALSDGALTAESLLRSAEQGRIDAGGKAALAILLQDDGRLLEALELYGVAIEDDLRRLCGGQKIYPPACCAYADEKWVSLFHQWLRASAPWLLENATRREAKRITAWAAEKKSRRRRLPALKLLIFPGQHHSRKASLMLTSADLDGASPRLEIQATGGNTRLHDSAWQRPLEIDLIRYQV